VLAVYAATTVALERARSGSGPSLIEAYTYRMGAHTTSDDPTKYRLADELEHWRLKDPIERVRAYLTRSGSGDEAFFADVEDEASDYAADLRARCLALPDPHLLDLFDHVYAEQTPYLAEQKAKYAEYLATFEEAGPEPGPRQAQPASNGQPEPAYGGGVH
jgi:2-oxoisovalerate dehydrogenase E1 component alpha subunit